MNCPKCQAICDDKARFCGVCGSPLGQMGPGTTVGPPLQYKCPSCGTLFTVSVQGAVTVECPGCHRHLTVGTPAPGQQPPPVAPPPQPPPKQPPPPKPKPLPPPPPRKEPDKELIPTPENIEKFVCPKCSKIFAVQVVTRPATTSCPYCNQEILIQ